VEDLKEYLLDLLLNRRDFVLLASNARLGAFQTVGLEETMEKMSKLAPRNERAAAIHSVGVLLDRRRKEEEQHQKQNNNDWMMEEDNIKQGSRMAPFGEENNRHGMPMPSMSAAKTR
jgi:hypothetical protein